MDYDKEIKDIQTQIDAARIQVYHLEGALSMLLYLQAEAQKDAEKEAP